jgi:hypothetical protein
MDAERSRRVKWLLSPPSLFAMPDRADSPSFEMFANRAADLLVRRKQNYLNFCETLEKNATRSIEANLLAALAAGGVDFQEAAGPDWLDRVQSRVPAVFCVPSLWRFAKELSRDFSSDRATFFFALHEASALVANGLVDERAGFFRGVPHLDLDSGAMRFWPADRVGSAHAAGLSWLLSPEDWQDWHALAGAFPGIQQMSARGFGSRHASRAQNAQEKTTHLLRGYLSWRLRAPDGALRDLADAHEEVATLCLSALEAAAVAAGAESFADALERLSRGASEPEALTAEALDGLRSIPLIIEEQEPGRERVLRFPLIDGAFASLAAEREKAAARALHGFARELGEIEAVRKSSYDSDSTFVRAVELALSFGESRQDAESALRPRSPGLLFRDGEWSAFFGPAPKIGATTRALSPKAEGAMISLFGAQNEFLRKATREIPPSNPLYRTEPGLGVFVALARRARASADVLCDGPRERRARFGFDESLATAEKPPFTPLEGEKKAFWAARRPLLPEYVRVHSDNRDASLKADFAQSLIESIEQRSVERAGRSAFACSDVLRSLLEPDHQRRRDHGFNGSHGMLDAHGRLSLTAPIWLRVGRSVAQVDAQASGSPLARLALARDLCEGTAGEKSEQRLLAELRANGLSEPAWRLFSRFDGKSVGVDQVAQGLSAAALSRPTRSTRKTHFETLIGLLNACADATVEPAKAQALVDASAYLVVSNTTHCARPLALIAPDQPRTLSEEEKAVAAEKRAQRGASPQRAQELDERLRQAKANRVARLAAEREADKPARLQIARALADFAHASFAEIASLPPDPDPSSRGTAQEPLPMPRAEAHARLLATINDLADWTLNCPGERAELPKKFGVSALIRRSEAWHERLATQQAEANAERVRERVLKSVQATLLRGDAASREEIARFASEGRWPSAVETVEDAPPQGAPAWVAVGLCSEVELLEEGAAMRHCVGSYADACAQGHSRIFSLRDADGKRLATLEIKPEKSRGEVSWPIAQLRGVCNDLVVDPRALALADLVARRYAEQARRNREAIALAAAQAAGEAPGAPAGLPAGDPSAPQGARRLRRAP